MTISQEKKLQFCYAVIQGNTDSAQKLLSDIDLYKIDDSGFSPAIFCLWAATQDDPEDAIKKFQDLFPTFALPAKDRTQVSPEQIQATVRSVIFPELQTHLHQLLKPLAESINVLSSSLYGEALRFILDDKLFIAYQNVIKNLTETFDPSDNKVCQVPPNSLRRRLKDAQQTLKHYARQKQELVDRDQLNEVFPSALTFAANRSSKTLVCEETQREEEVLVSASRNAPAV